MEELKEKRRIQGKLYVRTWKPVEDWREATEEEKREIENMMFDSAFFEFKESIRKVRRFMEKLREAFEELE